MSLERSVSVHKQLEVARQVRKSRTLKGSTSDSIYEHLNKQQPADGDLAMLEKQAAEQADEDDADRLRALRRQTTSRLTIMGLRSPIDEGAPGALLASCPFQACMAIVILLNAVVIGLETNYPELYIWDPVELFFLVVFLGELGLRVLVFGPSIYFHFENPDIAWNMFDVTVVASGVFGTVASSLNLISGDSSQLATLLRVVRLLRVFRIFRIVRFLKELYMLVFGFGIAAVATLWVTALAIVIMYVYAIIAVRIADTIPPGDEDYELLQNDFNKIGQSMFVLFELMLQAKVSKYEHAMETYAQVTCLIIGFLVFARFGMLSLLTGVITECMFEQNTMKQEEEQNQQAERRRLLSALTSELFDDMLLECCEDQCDKYNVELPMNLAVTQIPKMMSLLNNKGFHFSQFDIEDALAFADTDASGSISKAEFMHAVSMITSEVHAGSILELHSILQQNATQTEKRVAGMVELIDQQDKNEKAGLSRMCENLSALDRKLDRLLSTKSLKLGTQSAASPKSNAAVPQAVPAADADSSAEDKQVLRLRACLAKRIDDCEAMVREMRQPINEVLDWARKSAAPELHAVPTGVDPWSAREFEAPLDM